MEKTNNFEYSQPGESNLADFARPEKNKEKFPPELAPYAEKMKKFIEINKMLFVTVARDISLKYEPDLGFHINFKTGKIGLDVRDFKKAEEQGESLDQILWSTLHEIGHFQDLLEDPQGVLNNFAHIKNKAREIAPRVLKIWENKLGGSVPNYLTKPLPVDPENPEEKMSFAEIFVYKAFHQLYNCLDDIYVNNNIGKYAQPFSEKGTKVKEVKRLYRDYLFPTDKEKVGEPPKAGQAADYSKLPLNYQFTYHLLRKHMVSDQEIIISPDVKKAIETVIYGKFTVEDLVKTICSPTSKYDKTKHNAIFRHEQIKKHIEPIFTDLFLQDVLNLPPPSEEPQKQEGEGGEGIPTEPSKGEPEEKEGKPSEKKGGEPSEQVNPWQPIIESKPTISKKEIEDFIKDQKEKEAEAKKEKEEKEKKQRLTPKERAKQAQKQDDEKFCREHNIDPEIAEEYREIEESIEPYRKELAEIFKKLTTTIQDRIIKVWEQGFRSGKFNIGRFIKKYGQYLQEGAEQFIPFDMLDVYDQREFISRLSVFPEKIKIRLVLDGSGSMTKERILALKQVSVLILEALASAQSDINNSLKNRNILLREPFRVDTEIRMFGSRGNSVVVKSFDEAKKYNPDEERADRLKGYSQIHNGYGGTCDAEPWWLINESIGDEKYINNLKTGKAKELIFETTDGGSNESYNPNISAEQDTRDAIHKVNQKGAITRAFQIGDPDEQEKNTFDNIWGKDGERIPHISTLVAAVAKILAEELRKIEIEITEEDED